MRYNVKLILKNKLEEAIVDIELVTVFGNGVDLTEPIITVEPEATAEVLANGVPEFYVECAQRFCKQRGIVYGLSGLDFSVEEYLG